MPHIDKKKSKEKGVPIVDFDYIFFGRHKSHKAAKYFTVFVFFIIFIAMAAYWMQPPQIAQPQYTTPTTTLLQQQTQETVFIPSAELTKYRPTLVMINGTPAWEYSLPEGTVIATATDGKVFSATPGTFLIESIDSKWILTYTTTNPIKIYAKSYSKNVELIVIKGDKLFSVDNGDSNFIFRVMKISECRESPGKICPFVDPQEYFNSQ